MPHRLALEHDAVGTTEKPRADDAVGKRMRAGKQGISVRHVADVLRHQNGSPGTAGSREGKDVREVETVVEVYDIGCSAGARQAAQRWRLPQGIWEAETALSKVTARRGRRA